MTGVRKRGSDIIRRLRGERSVEDYRRAGASIGRRVLINGLEINLNDCPFVTIGSDVVFGPQVIILAHDASLRSILGYTRVQRVTIEDGVFVGARTVILPGAQLGAGSIIAAGSVVRGIIPEGEVWGGVPARLIGTVDALVEKTRARVDAGPRFEDGWKEVLRNPHGRAEIQRAVSVEGWFY